MLYPVEALHELSPLTLLSRQLYSIVLLVAYRDGYTSSSLLSVE